MTRQSPIPVIDLFAGPGGLGEGFSSIVDGKGNPRFALRVSIEKDPVAHRTLSLRALFRSFRKGAVPDCYYDYVQGKISREDLFAHPAIPEEARLAASEAKNAELGKTPHEEIDNWIEEALRESKEWILIGGPPCQAYSMAGRSRRAKEDTAVFESDKRHMLYREYLRIISRFGPSVFVMENVKGILSSKHGGSLIFERILADLASPGNGLEYRIHSFVVQGSDLEPKDFVIEAERFGIPQNRHRVILFGIRSDLADGTPALARQPERFVLKPSPAPVCVKDVLSGLPRLRSRLSKEADSHEAWLTVLKKATESLKGWHSPIRMDMEAAMGRALRAAKDHDSHGVRFDPRQDVTDSSMPTELRSWFHDPRLGGVLQHDTRSHMRSDLYRYLFASCYADAYKISPNLRQFPPRLLPDHANATPEQVAEDAPFVDRFRVQRAGYPSTTVTCHIAKDGHYFIHPDPSQCRSLTVREAARLQTFPDNYFFEGGRTDQYTQVGNAVPPLLARKVAEIVLDFLTAPRCR